MNRIRELRQQMGWKQEELAIRLNVKRTTVSNYEVGLRDLDSATICRLCDIFGCTADYLLGRSDNPKPLISDSDAALLQAYHNATPEIRAIVDTALAQYRGKDSASVTA